MDEEDYSKESKKLKQKRKEGIDLINLMFLVDTYTEDLKINSLKTSQKLKFLVKKSKLNLNHLPNQTQMILMTVNPNQKVTRLYNTL